MNHPDQPPEIDPAEVRSFVDNCDDRLAALDSLFEDEPSTLAADIPNIDPQNRYVTDEKIGTGGMKDVYRTLDRISNRDVAMARLRDPRDAAAVEAFLYEARITAALQHPNVMPVYDIGFDGEPYFIMKLVANASLRELITNRASDDAALDSLLDVFLKVCDAVSHAHARGIVHLDLKPSNVRVGRFGDVSVCDWGLAQLTTETGEQSTSPRTDPEIVQGTPGFIAPEQTQVRTGIVDERTDVYALGAILYTILCGQPPIDDSEFNVVIERTRNGDFQLPSERTTAMVVPSSLEAVALKALATIPDARYQNVSDLSAELVRFRGGFATEVENAGFLRLIQLLIARNTAICATIAIALIAIIASTTAFVSEIQHRETMAIQLKNDAQSARDAAMQEQAYAEQAKRQAEVALAEAMRERASKLAVGELADTALAAAAKASFEAWDFDEAKQRAALAVEAAPNSFEAWREKAFIDFLEHDFGPAIAGFLKAEELGADSNEDIRGIAEKYQNRIDGSGRLSGEQLGSLFSELEKRRTELPYRMLRNNIAREVPLSEHLIAAKKLFELDHKQNPEAQASWVLSNTTPQAITELTITCENGPLRAFDGLLIESLVLTCKKSQSLLGMADAEIKNLDLRNVRTVNVWDLQQGPKVEKVTLRDGQLPVEKLDQLRQTLPVHLSQ